MSLTKASSSRYSVIRVVMASPRRSRSAFNSCGVVMSVSSRPLIPRGGWRVNGIMNGTIDNDYLPKLACSYGTEESEGRPVPRGRFRAGPEGAGGDGGNAWPLRVHHTPREDREQEEAHVNLSASG